MLIFQTPSVLLLTYDLGLLVYNSRHLLIHEVTGL